MKNPFTKSTGGEQSPAPLLAALVLVALVPVAGVLWFMTVAMRNERLAVQDQLGEVYSSHLASLQGRVTAFANERQAALHVTPRNSPSEIFAAVVHAGLADGVVVYDGAGKVLYPALPNEGAPLVANADGMRARELQAQAGALLQSGQREFALEKLAVLVGDASLRQAVGAQGAMIVPNAQLLILKTLDGADAGRSRGAPAPRQARSPELVERAAVSEGNAARAPRPQPSPEFAALRLRTLDDLVKRLNDYSDAAMSSNQRRFLMAEVSQEWSRGALAPRQARSPELVERAAAIERNAAGAPRPQLKLFPTLAAEELAAEYLEHDPAPPAAAGVADPAPASAVRPGSPQARPATLQRTPLAKVWRLPGANGTVVALFREERLRAEIAKQLDPLALPDARVSVLAPGEAVASGKLVASQEIGGLLPGWRLGLSFREGDPRTAASARQTRFYLWTGVGVVLIIAVVALLVARYVSAQMRLARLKNELVSTVSHELRTPLASMRALVDTLLARRYSDPRQLDEYLQLVAKENQRLSQLIENFLAFSRLERGQHHFRFAEVAPELVVGLAVDALKDKLTSGGCAFEARIDAGLPRIRGDVDALSTVLVNLLDNAYKYTDGEKRIHARAYACGADVCFEIADNGIGLEASESKKIFERFYQVDQSLTRQRGGCGLGLSIVQSIVRAHHGVVDVESESGKGSTFRVTIPAASPAA